MSGRLVHGRDVRGDLHLRSDVVICGAGAGGCMAARELARAGLDVIVLEEGGDHLPRDFTQREDEMIPELFQQMGGRRTEDLSILIMSGRGLGGSTIHNQNLCKRAPAPILDQWQDGLGIEGVGSAALAPFYEEVERDLGVRRITDAQVNAHNRIIRRGVERLGWAGGRLSHNRDERCIGSGFCELGCAYDGKLNARRVLVPQAIEAGATFHTDARVDGVRHDGGRVMGVSGTLLDAVGDTLGRIDVDAPAVCLAGSAIGSAALALRSGVPDPQGRIGAGLHLHPGAVVAGVFEERIEAWKGIPQSEECTEYFEPTPGSDARVWLVPSFAHPVGVASLMPELGPDLMRRMRGYPHLAALGVMVHDETAGRVRVDGDRLRIAYEPGERDRDQLAAGVRAGAKLLLAAGARECLVPALPEISIRSEDDLDAVTASRFLPNDAKLAAVHPLGTLSMGREPASSVTDARGRFHRLRGLWAVDGSLFPSSIGVPPQISIYAFAMKVARHLAAAPE